MKHMIFMLTAVLAIPAAAETGKICAFGYCMGDSVSETPAGNANGVSYVKAEHPAFSLGLAVYFTGETGVCIVKGLDAVPSPDNYGRATRTVYERFRDRVANKYGEYEEFDHLHAGSIWNEPRYWLTALRKGERTLVSFWSKKNKSDLPKGLHGVSVTADASLVVVEYQFANTDDCMGVGEAKQSEGF